MDRSNKQPNGIFKKTLIAAAVVAALSIAVSVGFMATSKSHNVSDGLVTSGYYKVKRGKLIVDVTETGEIKALNSVDVKSDVEGRTRIISIVDEGRILTPEDVNKLIIVQLDASEIQQRLTQQEISFLSAEAQLTDANEALEIQKKQNYSDIKKGQMQVRFKLMDLEKYLGEDVAAEYVAAALNNGEHAEGNLLVIDPNIAEKLGGEALQKLRDLESDIKMKDQQLELAINKLTWTLRLFEKDYVSQSDKEIDELDRDQKEIAVKKAGTAMELFVKYEFPKECEDKLENYQEAKRELERIEAGARSKLAQAEARLNSAKATFNLQRDQLAKYRKQLKACVILAPATGQVVYSSSADQWQRQNQPIQIGADIHERQNIITIPDPCEMKVEIKIHENWINKVRLNQKAQISVSAFPDHKYGGEVIKKSPLADQSRWWANPDLKAYITDVSIQGNDPNLKTGMSAKVRIIIDELGDVLSVPVQAVVNRSGRKVCYVKTGNGLVEKEVETGAFNTSFVEIKSGLEEGQMVSMTPPRGFGGERKDADEHDKEAEDTKIVVGT